MSWILSFVMALGGLSVSAVSFAETPQFENQQMIKIAKKKRKRKRGADDEVVGETEDGRAIVRRGDYVEEDSSEFNRQGKKFEVLAELLGFTPFGTSGLTRFWM